MKSVVDDLDVPIDDWVQQMMLWHFSEETGSSFWLKQKLTFDFNPLTDITCLDDLKKFGLFDKSVLRPLPLIDLLPKGLAHLPRRVVETGGTTGAPCRALDITTGQYNISLFRIMLEERGLLGGNVVAMTPSGPHAYGHFVKALTDTWQGNCFSIDFDPRWVKHLIQQNQPTTGYIAHILEQTQYLLEQQNPQLLFTTSKLLLEVAAHMPKPLNEYGIKGVFTGGTSCSFEEERQLKNHFLEGIQWIDTYGNTLMGHALQGDPWKGCQHRAYYLPPPQAFISVVNPENWQQKMPVGERGQVLLQTLHRDLFIPNLLERDSAFTVPAHPWFPFSGVAGVQPFTEGKGQEEMTEGVY